MDCSMSRSALKPAPRVPRFNDIASLAGSIADNVDQVVGAHQASENVHLSGDDVIFALEAVINCIKKRGIAR